MRVYDARGNEVDNLDVSHPYGKEHWMGVGLKPGLPDGTYTGTYRVISADTHIVYGGLVFNIGHAGATPKLTVAGLIGRNKTGEVTQVAFGVAAGPGLHLDRAVLGGLAFVIAAWRRDRRPRTPGRSLAGTPLEQFRSATVALLLAAVALGTW